MLDASGKTRKTAVDGRTTRHEGYDINKRCRKRIEERFGWAKATGGVAISKPAGPEPQIHHPAKAKNTELSPCLGIFQQPAGGRQLPQ